MTLELVQQNWALVLASVFGLAIALFLGFRVLSDSRRGRLAAAIEHLRERERALARARKAKAKAAARLENLRARGGSVPPVKLESARNGLAEAEETEKLLADQVLVVRNTARTRILEDYPPNRHDAMLQKYLGETR